MQKYFKQMAERKSHAEAGILLDEVDLRITRGPRGGKGGLFKTFLQPGDSKTDPMSTNLKRTYSLMKRMNKPVVLGSTSTTNDNLQNTERGSGEPTVNVRELRLEQNRSMYETEENPPLDSVDQSQTIPHKINERIPVDKTTLLYENQKRSHDNRENRCKHNNKMEIEIQSDFQFNRGSGHYDHTDQMVLSPSFTDQVLLQPTKPTIESLVQHKKGHFKRKRPKQHDKSSQRGKPERRRFKVQRDAQGIDDRNGAGMVAALLADFRSRMSKVPGRMPREVPVPTTRTDPRYAPPLPSIRTDRGTLPDVGFEPGPGTLVASDLKHHGWQDEDNIVDNGESAADKWRPLLPFVFGMLAVSLVLLFLTTLYGGFYIIPLTRMQNKHTVRLRPQTKFTPPPPPKPLIPKIKPTHSEQRASNIPIKTGLGKRKGKNPTHCDICFGDMDLTEVMRAHSKSGRSRCCKLEPSNPNAIHLHDIKKGVWKIICGAETVTRHVGCIISTILSKIQRYSS